jgi:hypothetical protein
MIQPSNQWSLQQLNPDGSAAAATQTLASLGIDSAQYDLNNMAADVMTFTVGGLAIDAAELWPYGTLLALIDPTGVRRFFGRIEPWTRDGQPGEQNHLGRLVNPWWYLVNKIYQQRYTVGTFANYPGTGNPEPETYTTYSSPRVILNILFVPPPGFNPAPGAPPIEVNEPFGWAYATTGQQIEDALEWAILNGAPINIGQIDPAILPFSDFQKGITCADVIKKMFRLEPDFVMHWDYTTTPFPTVHFLKIASLTPLLIDLTDITITERVKISERPDWQKSYVSISYDQTNSEPSGTYLSIFEDLYPNPVPAGVEAQFTGVDLFCDLGGAKVTATSQSASFASLPFIIDGLSGFDQVIGWNHWKPDLNDPDIISVTILNNYPGIPNPAIVTIDEWNQAQDGSYSLVPYNPLCTFAITDGAWADWITTKIGNTSVPVIAQRVQATAHAQVVRSKGQGVPNAVDIIPLSQDFTVVNLNTYGLSTQFNETTNTIQQTAETIPVGLAQAMWTCWQNLALEGNFTNVEAVLGSNISISRKNCLNFKTAGTVNWTNVNAVVQRIAGDIATGVTSVQFGAPLHLTGHELIDAIRATRYRVTSVDIAYLFGGQLKQGGGTIVATRKTHAHAAQSGKGHDQVHVVASNPSAVYGIDPFIVQDGTTGAISQSPPNWSPTVVIDPRKAKGSDGNWHQLTIQEQKVCVSVNGVLKQRTLLALTSGIYQGEGDTA